MEKKERRDIRLEEASNELLQSFIGSDIRKCEARLTDCWRDEGLWFVTVGDFDYRDTILVCISCYLTMEESNEIFEALFHQLRKIPLDKDDK